MNAAPIPTSAGPRHPARLLLVLALLAGANLAAATLHVSLESPNLTPPYATWETAARVIQDAVDAAAAGDEIVVTNGVYATGGRAVDGTMTNRVAVTKALQLRSVNGPQFTIIQGAKAPGGGNGDGAVRCVYLAEGASLSGFTLTNGATRTEGDWVREQCGGGVWCEWDRAMVTRCVFTGNCRTGREAELFRARSPTAPWPATGRLTTAVEPMGAR